jgi:glyoxylase-like metal-dependent hydrolase (beta-lactamase superfamily II)
MKKHLKRMCVFATVLGSTIATLSCTQEPAAPEREITNVTGDLYRFREIRHIGMFLVTADGIIVVDPTNPGLAAWLKEELDRRFGLPVRYVIYSHSHNDHASGGAVFADTATFVGHSNMRQNLQKPPADAPLLPRERHWDSNGNGRIEFAEANSYAAQAFDLLGIDPSGGLTRSDIWEVRFGGGATRPPDIYYDSEATIRLGGKTVELHYMGRNHTDDMSVVFFPEERTIYTVDAMTPKRLPFTDLDGAFLAEWLAWLRQIETLDFDTVSPGHESLGTKADVTEQIRYMEDLIDAVSASIGAGLTKQETIETVRLEPYSHLQEYDNWLALNVGGAYEMLVSNTAP